MSKASIALNRFGLGAQGAGAVPSDPRAWLLGQFDRYDPGPPQLAGVKSSAEGVEINNQYRIARAKQRRDAENKPEPAMMEAASMEASSMESAAPGGEGNARRQRKQAKVAAAASGEPDEILNVRQSYLDGAQARLAAAVASETPFMERMVHFWSNHFAVSADNPRILPLTASFEMEAIRPHILGSFRDLLFAVETHPAMLVYLDQTQSIGPGSQMGARITQRSKGQRGGLNENLAREIMELHTLGVRSVYTQADVTEFARALTGWTVPAMSPAVANRVAANAAQGKSPTHFISAIHEPGPRKLIGRTYAQDGAEQSAAILSDLATHPATAKFIATKLARHFAGDEPSAALVGRLEADFLRTRGDLPSLYRVLIDAPEAWVPGPVKFRTPWEWTVSAMRAVGMPKMQSRQVVRTLDELGQPVWKPGSPAGFDDVAASWAAPDALMRRVEMAGRLATQSRASDPRQLAEALFPGALSPETAKAIARAESPVQGTALLLSAPEMMRR